MKKRVWLLVSAWLGISCVHAAEPFVEPIAGSYEVLICKESCDEGVLVKGRLVLLPDQKGCFQLEKVEGSGYRGYAGIDKAGITQWSMGNEGLTFQLYRSPDAGYKVTLLLGATNFEGTGRSWGAGVAAPQGLSTDKVVLRRTGAADPNICHSIHAFR